MTGLELAQGFYEEYGRAMIHKHFPEYEERIAVGFVGEGSECFGFDDEISRDHDFGPAFCMWLDMADYQRIGKKLQQFYEELPESYGGFLVRRDGVMTGHRTGVWEIGEFYGHFLLTGGIPPSLEYWLRLPESYLAVCVNGKVFRDDLGQFTKVRDILMKGYPEDVRIKKMAARAAVMSQAGQYNYSRCMKRGENTAAWMALAEFMEKGMSMVYLLNKKYAPFYKWMHRGMNTLECLGDTKELFGSLSDIRISWHEKVEIIEIICQKIASELKRQGLTVHEDPFLQTHIENMMEAIKDENLRKRHWLEG